MTGRALRIRVRAEQREARQAVVEENIIRPRGLIMAVIALCALSAFVRIIFRVTGITARLQCGIVNRLDVTVLALESLVRAVNLVVCVGIVIELHECPTRTDMAGFAGPTEMSVMVVVLEVTGNAGHVELVSEWVFAVAIVTTEFGM